MSVALPLLACGISLFVIWYCTDVVDYVDQEIRQGEEQEMSDFTIEDLIN